MTNLTHISDRMKWWISHIYFKMVKVQLHRDIMTFCKSIFLMLLQCKNSGTERELVCVFHFEFVLLVEIFCAAGLKMCVKHPHCRVCCFFAATSIFEAIHCQKQFSQVCEHMRWNWQCFPLKLNTRHTAEQNEKSPKTI